MINLSRVLTVFVLSATLFAGCGPSKKQLEQQQKQLEQQQKQQNVVIVRKIMALANANTREAKTSNEVNRMMSAKLDEARVLEAEYQGPERQQFSEDVTKLFKDATLMGVMNRLYHDALGNSLQASQSSSATLKASASKYLEETGDRAVAYGKTYTETIKLMKSKYLGEN